MKMVRTGRLSSKITVLYAVQLVDNLSRNVTCEFRYNKKDNKCRPIALWINGVNHKGKLRFFLDENGYKSLNTDDFLEKLASKVDVICFKRRRKKLA